MALTLSMTAMSPTACSEHELIAAARAGDDRAFEELYARYRERIVAFIHSRVRDHGRGEDVAQEVFISALRRLRASDQPIHFKPWIYEIAKNACIDEFRRTRRTREVSLDVEEDAGGPRPLLSLAPTPPAAVETKQRLEDLQGAFGGLSESHHQLLVLRELEGLSYDEIGARTGMSRQMVESALFRARRKLTDEYNDLASGRRCEQVQSAIDDGRARSQRSLGLRERRQFARHLAHCQPCRQTAHLAGVDESLVQPRRVGAKIAALLPFPLWRWPWDAGAAGKAAARAGSHPAVQSVQSAALLSEPASASALGGAAVAAAVLVLTGAGVGLVSGSPDHHGAPPVRPELRPAAARSSTVAQPSGAPASAHGARGSQAGRLNRSARAGSRARVHPVSVRAVGPAALANATRRPAVNLTLPAASAPRQASKPGLLPGVKAPRVPGGMPAVTAPAPVRTITKTLGGALGNTVNTVKKVVGSTPGAQAGQALGATTGATGGAANGAASTARSTVGAGATTHSAVESVTGN